MIGRRVKHLATPPPDTIDINGISLADAAALLAISRRVGGFPFGPRGAADRLMQALEQAGITFDNYAYRLEGGLHFNG